MDERRIDVVEDLQGMYSECMMRSERDIVTLGPSMLQELIERISRLERENEELRAKVARLDWQPITEHNLPKAGDEAYRFNGRKHPLFQKKYGRNETWAVPAICYWKDMSAEDWKAARWTHFRPIAPPAASVEGKSE